MSSLTREEIELHLKVLRAEIAELKQQQSKFEGMLYRLNFPGESHEVGTMKDESGRIKVLCKTCGFETPWLREDPMYRQAYGSPSYAHTVYEHKRDPDMPWSEDGTLVDDD